MEEDPLLVQKNLVSKCSPLGRNNKIFQKHFWLLLQHLLLPTKMCSSENKKWSFCGKNHFLFFDQVQKMHLSYIAKNGPKTHNLVKYAFSLLDQKVKNCFFVKKITFGFLAKSKEYQFYLIMSFWPIFGNMTQMHFLDLIRKQEVIFFTKRSLFIFWATHFSGQKKVLH